jgi:hypothetical protein
MILLECHSEEQERRESWHQGGQGLPARVTRQKTRASASTHEDLPATDVALVPPRSPAQHEDPLLMDDEGMWLNFVLLFFICSPDF